MQNKVEGKTRKQPWSYRPTKEVEALVEEFKSAMRIDILNINALINEALRGRLAASALRVAERELAAKIKDVEQLRALAKKEVDLAARNLLDQAGRKAKGPDKGDQK